MRQHRDYWLKERESYYIRRRDAQTKPDESVVLIIDSMDQNNATVPYLFNAEDRKRYPVRITGVIAHGLPDPYFAFINTRWRGDSNTNIHCLLHVLEKVR
jgi:hypothetical protein